jgi:hypothetical protein
MIHRLSVALRIAIMGLALAACGGGVPHPPYTSQPANALVEVDYPPPPARVEFVTPRPSSPAVWLNGEWSWTGRRWGWKPGGWVVVPNGAAYARLTLVRRNDGKLFAATGTWRSAKGEELAAPEFLSSSSTKSSGVVDPEGDPAPTAGDLQSDAGAEIEGSGQTREKRSAPNAEEPKPQEPKQEKEKNKNQEEERKP